MRAQVRAVDSRQHHSARTMHAKRGSQERAVGMCKHHTAAGLHERAGTAPELSALERVSQVRAVDMRQHHTAPGPCARNEFRKYEMFVCVSIVQLQACMSAQVRRQGYMRSKRVLQVRAVDMRQHHTAPGCMVINEYRKYEMSACVRIIQHEGASMSASTGCPACVSIMRCEGCMSASEYASTSCCHVYASYSTREHVRAQVRAVGMCQRHTARGMHERKRVPQVREDCVCQHHTARGL